jgi:hypothetical protein
MKTIKLTKAELAQRQRRKKMLLWQGRQLQDFKPFILVRIGKRKGPK